MKTLAPLSLCLAVALGMPAMPPSVAQSPALMKEDRSPLLGDWIPAQGHVEVEDPALQPKLSSKEQQEKLTPADVKQSQSTAELKAGPEVKVNAEVEAKQEVKEEERFKEEQEVKAEPEVNVKPEAEMQPELKADPDPEVELEVKVDPDIEKEPETEYIEEYYDAVDEQVMETEPLYVDDMTGNPELAEAEKSLRMASQIPDPAAEALPEEEDEAIMKESDYAVNEEPIVERKMMDEPSQNQDVMPDAASLGEGPALDVMGQQMSLSENYFPNEEAKMGMRKLEESLTVDAPDYLIIEEAGPEFMREEPAMEDNPSIDGVAQIGEMSVNEPRTADRSLLLTPGKQGQSCCPGVVLDGKCYQFFKGPKRAADAEFFCQEHFPGGHLASITSEYNHREIMNMMLRQNGVYTRTWIGGLRFLETGRFIWLDGSRWSYADWLSGEPNNTADLEDCLEVLSFGNGKFNDFTCWEPQAFICSYPH